MESEIFRFIITLDIRNKSNRIQSFLYFARVINFLTCKTPSFSNKIVMIINAFAGVTVREGVGRAKAWLHTAFGFMSHAVVVILPRSVARMCVPPFTVGGSRSRRIVDADCCASRRQWGVVGCAAPGGV